MNVKSSQQAEEDNEQRKRQEQIMLEKLMEQEAMMEEDQKVSTPPPTLLSQLSNYPFLLIPNPLLSRTGIYRGSQWPEGKTAPLPPLPLHPNFLQTLDHRISWVPTACWARLYLVLQSYALLSHIASTQNRRLYDLNGSINSHTRLNEPRHFLSWNKLQVGESFVEDILLTGRNTFMCLCLPQSPSHKSKRQQQELIQELRRKQVKDSRHVYEGKDGAIEDIITGNVPRITWLQSVAKLIFTHIHTHTDTHTHTWCPAWRSFSAIKAVINRRIQN